MIRIHFIGHDGRRIAIDKRYFDAFFANTSCGLGSRIIEFTSLSDDDRATADDEYVF